MRWISNSSSAPARNSACAVGGAGGRGPPSAPTCSTSHSAVYTTVRCISGRRRLQRAGGVGLGQVSGWGRHNDVAVTLTRNGWLSTTARTRLSAASTSCWALRRSLPAMPCEWASKSSTPHPRTPSDGIVVAVCAAAWVGVRKGTWAVDLNHRPLPHQVDSHGTWSAAENRLRNASLIVRSGRVNGPTNPGKGGSRFGGAGRAPSTQDGGWTLARGTLQPPPQSPSLSDRHALPRRVRSTADGHPCRPITCPRDGSRIKHRY